MPGIVLGGDLERCRDVFSGGEPYGADARYDETFFTLKTEIQKLTADSSGQGQVDWKAVRAWSIEILGSKSKDLTAAGYLTLALLMTDGYRGLADGLEIVEAYLKDHWDGVFPAAARPRPRILALEWLVQRVAPIIEDRAPADAELDVIEPLRARVQAIQEQASQRLQHEAPSFSDLLAALSAHAAAVAERRAAAAAPGPPAPAETAQSTSSPPAALPAAPQAGGPAPQPQPAAVKPQPASPGPAAAPATVPLPADGVDVKDQLRPLIGAFRQAEPLSPVPYRMLRSLKWDVLTGPPPADPGSGRTRIPAPRPQQRSALEGLFSSGQWEVLAHGAEGAFADSSGTFWLDLQRYTALALERLDPGGAAARVVREEAVRLCERWPSVVELSFVDGAPFASEATRAWLDEIGQASSSLLPPLSRTGAEAEPTLSEDELAEARDLFARKRLAAALDVLQRGIERATGTRARFRTRLAAGRLCLEADQANWAKTLLEELQRDIEGFTFERWEPDTAVELYQLLAICYGRLVRDRKAENRESLRDALETIKARLFRLDMRAAATVEEMLRK